MADEVVVTTETKEGENQDGEGKEEGQEIVNEQAEVIENEKVTEKQHDDGMIPRERYNEKAQETQYWKQRAEDTERQKRELEEKTSPRHNLKTWYEQTVVDDPFGANLTIAQDIASRMVADQIARTDMVEEIAESNPEFKKYEKEIKRKIRTIPAQTEEELQERIKLEFEARLGRELREREMKAREKGKKDALQGKQATNVGSAVGTTTSRGTPVGLKSHQKALADAWGITPEEQKAMAKRGTVIE